MSRDKHEQLIKAGRLNEDGSPKAGLTPEQAAEEQDFTHRLAATRQPVLAARAKAAEKGEDYKPDPKAEKAVRDLLGHQPPDVYEQHGVTVTDEEREAYAAEAANPTMILQFRQDGTWDDPVPPASPTGTAQPPPIQLS